MPIIVDEKRMVDDNITAFENRMNSKLVRFVDHTQTYVTYYHIINPESTTDDGFIDIESLVGQRSPFRYQKISHFPLYGIEALIPQLQDNEFGLDTSIEGEAIIMPGTIKPLQNSFFFIEHLELPAVFRITEIAYDNVRPDNYYQIHYRLEYIDEERIQQLEKKVLEDCECILENIGSEERCIVRSVDYIQIQKVQKMKDDMMHVYLHMYYDKIHNSLLVPYHLPGYTSDYLYDPFLAYFINSNNILGVKNGFSTIVLTDQFNDPMMKLKYERSIYRLIERRDISLLHNVPYNIIPAYTNERSTFSYYYADNIYAVDIVGLCNGVNIIGTHHIFTDDAVEILKSGEVTENPAMNLLMHFLHQHPQTVHDIPLDLNTEILKLQTSIELYFFTPILAYVIDQIIQNS